MSYQYNWLNSSVIVLYCSEVIDCVYELLMVVTCDVIACVWV